MLFPVQTNLRTRIDLTLEECYELGVLRQPEGAMPVRHDVEDQTRYPSGAQAAYLFTNIRVKSGSDVVKADNEMLSHFRRMCRQDDAASDRSGRPRRSTSAARKAKRGPFQASHPRSRHAPGRSAARAGWIHS